MLEPVLTCVVFDVDDTLYLEREYVRSGFQSLSPWVTAALGMENFADRAWAEFEEGRRGDIFDRVLSAAGFASRRDLVSELVVRYRQHQPTIRLLRDAQYCLEALSGRVYLAAITDGPAVSQRAKVAALGLRGWINLIILTSELGEGLGKPHPRAFGLVEEATGLSGRQCVYVADNPTKDFAGPAALGWRTVRVRRIGGLHYEAQSGADVEVEFSDLSALTRWLEVAHDYAPPPFLLGPR